MNKKTKIKATIKKIKTHKKPGVHKPTSIDVLKKVVEFRILQVSPYVIRWKSGKTETVTKRQLDKLKKEHSWSTDF